MKKRILILAMVFLMAFTPCLQAVDTYIYENSKVTVNGEHFDYDVLMHKNMLYIPLRTLFSLNGSEITYN